MTQQSALLRITSSCETEGFLWERLWARWSQDESSVWEVRKYICEPGFQCVIFVCFYVAQMVKNLPAIQETWVWSLDQEDPLEKEMTTHSSTLAWKIPGTEEAGRLPSMGLQRVRHHPLGLTKWKRASSRLEAGTSGFLSISDSDRRIPAELGQESLSSSLQICSSVSSNLLLISSSVFLFQLFFNCVCFFFIFSNSLKILPVFIYSSLKFTEHLFWWSKNDHFWSLPWTLYQLGCCLYLRSFSEVLSCFFIWSIFLYLLILPNSLCLFSCTR